MNPPGSGPRRIASLVPAATENLYVLGVFDRVVGVTHACDFPPGVAEKTQLTRPRVDPKLPSKQLDAAIRLLAQRREPAIDLDHTKLGELRPDLVVSQSTCESCAITPASLEPLKGLRPRPEVVDYHPHSYEEVMRQTMKLGDALLRRDEAKAELLKQWSLAKEIRARTRELKRPRVAVLDWLDPVMVAGHWTKELVEMAGGSYDLVETGRPSRKGTWEELVTYAPDVLIVAPCGRSLQEGGREMIQVLRSGVGSGIPAVAAGRVYAADGNRFFNRPGPRLIYSAAIMARALHPDEVPKLPDPIESGFAQVHATKP